MRKSELKGHLFGSPGKELDLMLPVHVRPRRQRFLNAWLYLVGAYLLVVPMFFVPFFHYVIVPFLLVGGPIAAFFASKNVGQIPATELLCPDCGKSSRMNEQRLRSPIYLVCSNCGQHIMLEIPKL